MIKNNHCKCGKLIANISKRCQKCHNWVHNKLNRGDK